MHLCSLSFIFISMGGQDTIYGLRKLGEMKGQCKVRCDSGKISSQCISWNVLESLLKSLES